MNNLRHHSHSNTIRLLLMVALVLALTFGTGLTAQAAASQTPVNLGAAASFVILTKSGITNVPTSKITGNLGVSPIAATAITGFSLVADPTNTFSTSAQVTGKIYAANYASPTPANLTTAIGNMQTAYTNAAGRPLPNFVNLYAGNLSGRTLVPGLYKWSTGVLLTTNVTLAGASNAVWIFQIAGNLTLGSGAKVLLSGGANASNIFWQVGGGAGAEIGTTAHVEGTILAKTAIHLRTGASLNGRALAQTAVTLDENTLVIPVVYTKITKVFPSVYNLDGYVLESSQNSGVGGSMNSTDHTFILGDDAANRQYRSILDFKTILPSTAIVTSVTLRIYEWGVVGTNPFSTLGSLGVSIRKPFFGTSSALQISDFQADSSRVVANIGSKSVGSWYSATLSSVGRSLVNLSGPVQFRLAFSIADNNNHSADYMKFFSGDAGAVLQPQLVVVYYIP